MFLKIIATNASTKCPQSLKPSTAINFLPFVTPAQQQRISLLLDEVITAFGPDVYNNLPAGQRISLLTWKNRPTAMTPVSTDNQYRLSTLFERQIPLGNLLVVNTEESDQELLMDLAHEWGHLSILVLGEFNINTPDILMTLNFFEKNPQYNLALEFLNSMLDYFVLKYQHQKKLNDFSQGYLENILLRTAKDRQKQQLEKCIIYAKIYLCGIHFLEGIDAKLAVGFKAKVIANLALTTREVALVENLAQQNLTPMFAYGCRQNIYLLLHGVNVIVQTLRERYL